MFSLKIAYVNNTGGIAIQVNSYTKGSLTDILFI